MYKPSIISFLDVLGFRSLVSSSPCAEIASILDVFQENSTDSRGDDPLGLRVTAFSDSVVRSRPADAPAGAYVELMDLMRCQAELVRHRVLVRGGVTFGDIAWGEGKIFGPGFIEAYELESSVAVYPRIVVSPALFTAVKKGVACTATHHAVKDDLAYIRALLTEGDDGVWFIDYLRAFVEELVDPAHAVLYLREHRQVVLDLAKTAARAPAPLTSLGLKVNWLAKYHNATVHELSEKGLLGGGVDKPGLLVKGRYVASLVNLPKAAKS